MDNQEVYDLVKSILDRDAETSAQLAALAKAQASTLDVVKEASTALKTLAVVEHRKVEAMEQNLAFRREVVKRLIESRPFWGVVILFSLTLAFWLGLPPGVIDAVLAKVSAMTPGVALPGAH